MKEKDFKKEKVIGINLRGVLLLITSFPVQLENGIKIIGNESYFRFNKTNGYDSNNNRVTNIVGFDGSELLKECPNCISVKRPVEFGPAGRQTNPTNRRDQSWCIECRKSS